MSTRANIIIKESYSYNDEKGKEINVTNQLFFYRHSDGYPDGAMPTLNIFMEWLKSGKIRTDLQQATGLNFTPLNSFMARLDKTQF